MGFRGPSLRTIRQVAEQYAGDRIAGERLHSGVLAERLGICAAGFRRLRLREPILRKGVRSARNREQKDNDPKRHQQQAGASTPSGGLFWTGGRVLHGLAHLGWLE